MESGALHREDGHFIEVNSHPNGYELVVNDRVYAYFSEADLIRGMIIHTLADIRTAVEVENYRELLDVEPLVPAIKMQAEQENYNLYYFKTGRIHENKHLGENR